MAISDVKTRVYSRICAGTPGRVWWGGDFDDFAPPDTVKKALHRLTAAGSIRRIDRGLYDRPKLNNLTGKPQPADYRAIIDAIAKRDKTRMLVDGMTAANDLGLSDAVPGRVIIHSDARLRPIHLGNITIKFKLTSASKLYWAGRPAMRIIQALHWLKFKLEDLEERKRIKRRINALLSDPTHGLTLRKDIRDGLSVLPAWMQEFLSDLTPLNHISNRKPVASRQIKKQRKIAVL